MLKAFYPNIVQKVLLKDRDCSDIEHNRDVNAAINIKNFALRDYVLGRILMYLCIKDALDALYINLNLKNF